MEAQIVDNVSSALGDVLNELLPRARLAKMSVAFVRMSGVSIISDAIDACLTNSGQVEFIVGLDFSLTEPQAIWELATRSPFNGDIQCLCFLSSPSATFHPKLYIISDASSEKSSIVVGSSNLTAGGLFTNREVNAIITGRSDDRAIRDAYTVYNRFLGSKRLFTPDEEFLEDYSVTYEAVKKRTKAGRTSQLTTAEKTRFEDAQERLPGTLPTQRDLVVEAIQSLSGQGRQISELSEIYVWVEQRVQDLGLDYKMDTLRNSLRRAINVNVVGKDGGDLFVRVRRGHYMLSEQGADYTLPHLVAPIEHRAEE